MIKNTFYLTLKALFLSRYLDFCLDFIYGHVEKRHDKKDKIIFKLYDVITRETINCNAHITQYLKK